MAKRNNFSLELNVEEKDFSRLLEIWEASIRATHHFLKESDIRFYKPIVMNSFSSLTLACIRNELKEPVGFIGVTNKKIEMLFVDPAYFGKGIGRQLVEYAVSFLGASKLDVNEQNKTALGFYEHLDFEVVGGSDVDAMGKPFPLLHMINSKLPSNLNIK